MHAYSTYKWLEKYLGDFLLVMNAKGVAQGLVSIPGVISAHGDKFQQYKETWEKNNIPLMHGALIYMLTYFYPWNEQVRETKNGWVAPVNWVIANYENFKPYMEDYLPLEHEEFKIGDD